MATATALPDRPAYDQYECMADGRAHLAQNFARQILATAGPYLAAGQAKLDVLDVGCGYGHTALELARSCRQVVGIEPSADLAARAVELAAESGLANVSIRQQGIGELNESAGYDLVVLDNVFEHLQDQTGALRQIHAALRPGGAAYLLMPNKLWPVEVHYHLPFLSYLPLRLANAYLRCSGRGRDYTDASYAPTFWRLKRLLHAAGFQFHFTLPADITLATCGQSLHYRLGVAALRRCPWLWAVSKAFLVIAVKP